MHLPLLSFIWCLTGSVQCRQSLETLTARLSVSDKHTLTVLEMIVVNFLVTGCIYCFYIYFYLLLAFLSK